MLKNNVLEWLRKTGFPLEMETASALRAAGFDIRQSFSYSDPQSDKGREIDVLAVDHDIVGLIDISFVFECKSSKNPWIVLTSEDALENYNRLHSFAITSEAAKKSLTRRLNNQFGALKPYICRPSQGGYGLKQALGGNNDTAYSAAIGVLKASSGVAGVNRESQIPYLSFVFPVIVVDSPLFECSLKSDGDLELKEVEESEFLFSAHIPHHVGTCIKIIKKERLKDFAKNAKTLAETIRMELKDDENKALQLL